MYQDLEELAKERSSDDEQTQEYDFVDPANQTLIGACKLFICLANCYL